MVLDNNLLLTLAVYGGVVVVVFWLAMVLWAYRDMRARSRDGLAQLFAASVVAILNVPGLFIYILMRPRETLSEAYERSLEEEALLQEIEEKPTCPGVDIVLKMNGKHAHTAIHALKNLVVIVKIFSNCRGIYVHIVQPTNLVMNHLSLPLIGLGMFNLH